MCDSLINKLGKFQIITFSKIYVKLMETFSKSYNSKGIGSFFLKFGEKVNILPKNTCLIIG